MSKLEELSKIGQAIWIDYIRRSFITSGDLQKLIDQGLRGITSNPTIFEKAIVGSSDYDEQLLELMGEKLSTRQLYDRLSVDDIRMAAELLKPVYDKTGGLDGYVSLEVDPTLAHDTDGTIEEARRLFSTLNMENVMIKVPATPEGIPAIAALISEGINVNVTLIFAVSHYEAAAEAYLAGLEKRAAAGQDIGRVASVASMFVSRVDTAVDKTLENMGEKSLQGKTAIANAKAAYARFGKLFSGDRWEKLASKGARVQRVLWGSTSTKNPSYPDTIYVDELIGPSTVNTIPPDTLTAYMDHGTVAETVTQGLDEAYKHLGSLSELGVNLDEVTETLQRDGVSSFAKSFEDLLAGISEKRSRLHSGKEEVATSLGEFQPDVDAALDELRKNDVAARIWAHDYTLWKPEPTEIVNRMSWLTIAMTMEMHVSRLRTFVQGVRDDGYTHALLLGMGGSSLAPDVFAKTFGAREGYLELAVLDSTDPRAVLEHANSLDMSKTLFIVSTKSGTTTETLSFFKYFFNQVLKAVGPEKAGDHFAAITDPGSKLTHIAKEYKFRETFENDPDIGGRYSVLSFFGMVPAAVIGMDVPLLLKRAEAMMKSCSLSSRPAEDANSGAWLGAVMGEMAAKGRDKTTLVMSPAIAPFGAWVEQLIAESTGKEGTGILPVESEAVLGPDDYANDRLFVHLRLENDTTANAALKKLADAGHPVVEFTLKDAYDLGKEFFRWEMATIVAGRRLGINPFDQPNVEAAKVLAREMTAAYQKDGKLPELTPSLTAGDVKVYAEFDVESPGQALVKFLDQADKGENGGKGRGYVSLQAYVQPSSETDQALQSLRTAIQKRWKTATTVGYGPRFLHSTGQLHKGDAGKGLFIQFIDTMNADAPIPDMAAKDDSSISFGILKTAQVLGDRKALLNNGRRVILFDLGGSVSQNLKMIEDSLK